MSKRRRQRNRGRRQGGAQPPRRPVPIASVAAVPTTSPVVPASLAEPVPVARPAVAKAPMVDSYTYVKRDIGWLAGMSVVLFILIGVARFVI